MADKRTRDQGKKNKLFTFSSNKNSTEDVMEVVKAGDMHSYTNTDPDVTPLPDSAPSTPATK